MGNLDFDGDWIDATTERLRKVYAGEIPDRVPYVSTMAGMEGSVATPAQLCSDPECSFEYQVAKIHNHQKYRGDVIPGVWPPTNVGLFASLFGAEIDFPENDWPKIVSHPLKDIRDVDNLEIPDIRKDGLGPHLMKTLKTFKRLSKGKINIGSHENDGPLYLAFGIRGPDLLTDFCDHPDLVRKLLKLSSDTIIEGIRVQREFLGVPMDRCLISVDDVCIPEGFGGVFVGATYACMLSPEMYREIVQPVDIEFYSAFGGGGIHTCGNHAHVFEALAELPATMLRFYAGAYEPAVAKRTFGKNKVIFGVKAGALGGAEPTYADMVETIKQCKEGGRFILGPNGGYEPMVRAVKEYGGYGA